MKGGFYAELIEAIKKAKPVVDAIKKSGFREYYNPLTGEGLGARDFGWGTLVADMILQK